ncbi:SpoIIE family protein phosphatase [Marispirochaeta aestuarii]|uniref:SpoIIE family protein phosphatase n=1 Tax=Marispirochaeta aestuarii TaxID=1963862 RepID=UPI0029C67411|nr:SpoIIE family protein phosphatase [Marispirochaeta aestuarii]
MSVEHGFIEVDYCQFYKHRNKIGGDVFLLSRREEDGRIICVLSDGLGSGVKANVLANLTATMAEKYVAEKLDVRRAAEIIMRTLPVCRERKISYATFSIIDVQADGKTEIVEYDNPRFLFYRGTEEIRPDRRVMELPRRFEHKEEHLYYTSLDLQVQDRLVFFSDGVSQSGMGSRAYPLGLRLDGVRQFTRGRITADPSVSARDLARKIAVNSQLLDGYAPKDDITCGVIYFRTPRQAMVATGPPMDPGRDTLLAKRLSLFPGKKIICGGTTAKLAARELGREVLVDLKSRDRRIPPSAEMDGIDLVTEGMLTLTETARQLETGEFADTCTDNAAVRLCRLLVDSDKVCFLVGTKINEAHQDPDMPVEIGIRRTLVKRICEILEKNYLKTTSLEFI